MGPIIPSFPKNPDNLEKPCYNSPNLVAAMQIPVLVLNANFEPLNVCGSRRAISLILDGKASLVINGRGEINTVSRSYQRPSVIRLSKMIKRPRPHVRLTKREILRRDNYVCQYCGQHVPYLTLDHIVPRHLGGQHTWENLVTACPACNHRKGGRTLEQAYMHLLGLPKEPPSSALYLFAHHLNQYQEWVPFVQGW
jgi:5-methylcytosine-specific restriction endonuclease McrA